MHEGACCSGGGRGDRSLRAAGCSVRCLLANLFGVSAQNEMNFGFTPLRIPQPFTWLPGQRFYPPRAVDQ